ncbi:hypothetical protein SBRCBS47491_007577 [Sporothrix bragantina]|uniref:RBR-type E3 ubiquitin transferase n=1 Tax=Sporothrix bragantina TaxID=671064 RepID=A0ABP0CF21_9PEZI
MNNREAAIAALLRQGWVPTSRPVATPSPPSVPVEDPAPAYTPSPVPAPAYTPGPVSEPVSGPVSALEPTPPPTSSQPDTASSSNLTSNYTLIDLSEETLPTSSPSPAPSSTPSSSRESLESLAAASSSSCGSFFIPLKQPRQDTAPEVEEPQPPQLLELSQDEEFDDGLFTPLPPFVMPTFPSDPPTAVRLTKSISPSMHDWILCSEVGLQFMRPARAPIIACVSCDTDCPDGKKDQSGSVFRSAFWRMTTCSAGHRPQPSKADTANSQAALCCSCDKEYVLQVVRGEQLCAHEGCQRRLRVHQDDVTDALWDHPGLLKAFYSLIKKYSGYECAIHFDRVDVDDNDNASKNKPLTDACNHDRNACAPCLTRMCEAAIQGDRLDDLVCPANGCRARLSRETLREYVSAASLRLYDKKLAFAAMARNPSFRWCRCGHGQLHEAGNEQPEWTCGKCQARHCFICQDDEIDVEGRVCTHLRQAQQARAIVEIRDAYERARLTSETMARDREAAQNAVGRLAVQLRENTRGTQMVIAGTTKRCPRLGCKAPIQRDEGCGHMTCRRCRTEFCWACKVIWKVPAGTVWGAAAGHVSCTGTLLPLHLTTCKLASERTIERRHLNTALYASRWDQDLGYDESLDVDVWLQENQQ